MKIYIANYDIGSMTPGQESRHQHMLGRQLLQTALSREGIPGDVSDENGLCALTYGPYGKPFLRELPNIQFNISHTKGLVVCAIGTATLGCREDQALSGKCSSEDDRRRTSLYTVCR